MSNSLARSPWQVVLASGALIVLGVTYATSALIEISRSGDRLGIDAYLSEYQAISGFEAESAAVVHEWMTLAAVVFSAVSAVFIILGILLWQGVARPGVRITATITTLIAFVGAFIPWAAAASGENAVAQEAILVQLVIHGAAFIAVLLLWMPAVRSWAKEPVA